MCSPRKTASPARPCRCNEKKHPKADNDISVHAESISQDPGPRTIRVNTPACQRGDFAAEAIAGVQRDSAISDACWAP
jgi:hypothetical protein